MDVEKLIACVFCRPPLWNQANPDHHNRYVIMILWTEVASEMNTSKDAVQKKWKYLRDYFRAQHVKIPQSRSGDASTNVTPSWPHYKQLLFLKDHVKNTVSQGNLLTAQLDNATTDSCSESFPDDETLRSGTPEASVSPEREPRVSVPQRARKRPSTLLGKALLDVEQQKLDYLKQKEARKSHECDKEDVRFFQSLLPHVAKIPSERKLLFRCKVQEIVQQFAYEIPRSHPTDTSTSAPEFTQQSTGTVQAVPAQFETDVTGYSDHSYHTKESLNNF